MSKFEVSLNDLIVIRRALVAAYKTEQQVMKRITAAEKAGKKPRIRRSEQAMAMAEISMLYDRIHAHIVDNTNSPVAVAKRAVAEATKEETK